MKPVAGPWLALVVALGCGTERVRPPGMPAPELAAVVRARKAPLAARYIIIHAVDGVPIAGSAFKTQEVELPPGVHLLDVAYIDGDEQSTQDARLRFAAEAGHVYDVGATGIHEGFWSEFGKGLAGGKGKWVAWLEDDATHAVVAGRRASGIFWTTFDDPPVPPPPPPD